jgi:hypothetical protein
MTATVQFREAADHYKVSFRYNPRLVEAIKATVPPGSRRWVPQQKHWLVDLWAAPELAEVLRAAGYRVIGLQVHRQLTDWATSLFQAVGEDRAPAVHRALSTVLHPDKSTGSTELQQQLNDGRRQVVEERQGAELTSSTPPVEYASTSSGDMFMRAIAEIADQKVRQLAAQTGLSVSHVRRLKQAHRLHELYDSDGLLKPKIEFRERLSWREAREQLEALRDPGSTLLPVVRIPKLQPWERRSSRQALLLTMAVRWPGAFRWG